MSPYIYHEDDYDEREDDYDEREEEKRDKKRREEGKSAKEKRLERERRSSSSGSDSIVGLPSFFTLSQEN